MVESSDVSIVVDAQDCPPLPGLYGIVKLLGMILSPATAGTFLMRLPPTRRLGGPLCPSNFGPTLEAVFHLLAVRGTRQQMPSWPEVLGDGAIRRQKALGMSRRSKPLHAILVLACGAM